VGSLVTALLTSPSLCVTGRVHTNMSLPVAAAGSAAGYKAPWTLAGAASKPIIGVLTVSDRASRGLYEDVSGPLLVLVLKEYLATDCHFISRMVPDEISDIASALRDMVAAGCALVCSTGGTGPAARDVTPEAMALVCEKTYDGFGEAMRRASVPTAILSRQSAASVGKTLIINLPGKPQAIRTCLDAVFPAGLAFSRSLTTAAASSLRLLLLGGYKTGHDMIIRCCWPRAHAPHSSLQQCCCVHVGASEERARNQLCCSRRACVERQAARK
jgi:molybdopterin adenylyltransferase